jgi:hypothetical protein
MLLAEAKSIDEDSSVLLLTQRSFMMPFFSVVHEYRPINGG